MTIKLKYLSDYAVGPYSSRWGVIRKRGATLSVGQRQRISLARAFLRDALILILDEFTSALDAGTERTVRASLRDLRKGKTTIIISHHPQVLADADRVILLEKGRITAEGRYGELEGRGGGFFRGTGGFPDSGEAGHLKGHPGLRTQPIQFTELLHSNGYFPHTQRARLTWLC
jgi:ABC-type multidrug transport system ATPase subunit